MIKKTAGPLNKARPDMVTAITQWQQPLEPSRRLGPPSNRLEDEGRCVTGPNHPPDVEIGFS